jgi:hypothetical protein
MKMTVEQVDHQIGTRADAAMAYLMAAAKIAEDDRVLTRISQAQEALTSDAFTSAASLTSSALDTAVQVGGWVSVTLRLTEAYAELTACIALTSAKRGW